MTSETAWRQTFFDVVADRIFERPQKFYGLVLERAYQLDLEESYPLEYKSFDGFSPDEGIDEADSIEEEPGDLTETGGRHSVPDPNSSSSLPNPGAIPSANTITVSKISRRGNRRKTLAEENSQVADLKENQYAWHCQACIAVVEPISLAPMGSYVAPSVNRNRIMEAHHCDHVNAGGARHVGNILLLCHYHHREFGDAVSRLEVIRALSKAQDRDMHFLTGTGDTAIVKGKIVTVHPPQRANPLSLFFTSAHADYWSTKADDEGLK